RDAVAVAVEHLDDRLTLARSGHDLLIAAAVEVDERDIDAREIDRIVREERADQHAVASEDAYHRNAARGSDDDLVLLVAGDVADRDGRALGIDRDRVPHVGRGERLELAREEIRRALVETLERADEHVAAAAVGLRTDQILVDATVDFAGAAFDRHVAVERIERVLQLAAVRHAIDLDLRIVRAESAGDGDLHRPR